MGELEVAGAAIAATPYDLMLLDLDLPDGDGVAFLRQLRRDGFVAPIPITSARDRISERIEGLKSGPTTSWSSPSTWTLLARVGVKLHRASMSVAPVREFGAIAVDAGTRRVRLHGAPVELTRREWGLPDRLSSRPAQVFSNAELEDSLYGQGFEVESDSIEATVSRVRAKLGKRAIVTVRGLG